MDIMMLALVAVAGYWLLDFGNRYVSNAQLVAKIMRELQETNKKIQQFEAEDARQHMAEQDRAAFEDAQFALDLSRVPGCVLTSTQAAALNKIGGTP